MKHIEMASDCKNHKPPYFIDPRDNSDLVCKKCEKKILAAFELLGIHPIVDKKSYLDLINHTGGLK